MNRKQRRKLNKQHHVNYNANEWAMIELYAKLRAGDLDVKDLSALSPEVRAGIHIDNEELVPEGTPVKLNVADILTRPTKGVTDKYLTWIKEHENIVFHVTREQANSSLVCLKEDVDACLQQTESTMDHLPWLFDIYSDLLYEENGEWKILEFLEKK